MDLARLPQRLRQPWLLTTVLIINLGGIAYGSYYYLPQFRLTPWYLWPLLPDSPMAVLLLSIALVLTLAGRTNRWMNLIGAAAMIQVGVWTAIVLLWNADHFGFQLIPGALDCSGTGFDFRCADLNTYLFYLHLAMAAEAILVVDLLPDPPRPHLILGGVILALDLIDYVYPADFTQRGCSGIYPYTVPCAHHLGTMFVTMGLTIATIAMLWGIGEWARKHGDRVV